MADVFEGVKNEDGKLRVSTVGKVLLGITGGVALALTAICGPFISPALRKVVLPYVPATHLQVRNVMLALEDRKGTVLDIGSGDGRIVLEAARNGFKADGVELNPWLVWFSNFDAKRCGLHEKVRFFRRNLWKFPMGNYDNIVVFGVDTMMGDLEKKLERECKPGCNVIACRFPLPNLKPVCTYGEGIDSVWVYVITAKRSGINLS